MSEVSLQAAYGAYSKHRSSNSIEDLYESIVKGQAEYGYNITHIYSFIDISKDVQLFYCRDGNHEDLLTSPYVKKRALLWKEGRAYSAPKYLKRAYTDFLHLKLEEKESEEARRVLYIPGQMGPEIRKRLESLGSDLSRLTRMRFWLDDIDWDDIRSVEDHLKSMEFETWSIGGDGKKYGIAGTKDIAVDDQDVSKLADELASLAKSSGGQLEYCDLQLIRSPHAKHSRKPWWKFWKSLEVFNVVGKNLGNNDFGKGVVKLEERKLIAEIAKQRKLVERSEDGQLLADIAKNGKDSKVCMEALNKIENQELLEYIVKNDENSAVRINAALKIKNQEILSHIAKNDENKYVRITAVKKIENQELLADIVKNDENSDVRIAAVNKMENQESLAYVAKNDENEYVRIAAVKKIENQGLLADIDKNDENRKKGDNVLK